MLKKLQVRIYIDIIKQSLKTENKMFVLVFTHELHTELHTMRLLQRFCTTFTPKRSMTVYASNAIRELERRNEELAKRVDKLERFDSTAGLWLFCIGCGAYMILSGRIEKEKAKTNNAMDHRLCRMDGRLDRIDKLLSTSIYP